MQLAEKAGSNSSLKTKPVDGEWSESTHYIITCNGQNIFEQHPAEAEVIGNLSCWLRVMETVSADLLDFENVLQMLFTMQVN